MCTMVWMGCVSIHVSFSQTRKARTVLGLAQLLPRQEFGHRVQDPQQLVARLHRKHENLSNSATSSTFTHEFCVRTIDFCDSPARTHEFSGFCESPARTHDFFVNLPLALNLWLVRMNFVNQHSLQHCESSTRCLWCVFRHQLSPDFEPVSVWHTLHQSQASSRGQCRQQGVQCVAQRWMSTDGSSVPAGNFATG